MNNEVIFIMENITLLVELQKKYCFKSMFMLIFSAFTIDNIKINVRNNNILQLFLDELHIKYISSKKELSYFFKAFKLLVDSGIFVFHNNSLRMIPMEYEINKLSNSQINMLNEISKLSEESFVRMVINYV
jgi:hypothetical protein